MSFAVKKTDLAVAAYLLAAVIFFIIPIPSFLLDIMLAVNISMALIILLNVLFVKEVLDLSFFPTLLLFTTIFRISLNVSSTRLILTTGSPGNVVETFGSFVGGGNLIIGAIVFIVLIIIQFMVINKGSERVAEVSARFTLDAMPGKQMAIDADLNTGAITDQEAKEKREKIQQESSFFGSMDGATKYVKGDATAGLIITFINFIGGTAMGVINSGLGFTEAIQQYGVLTIGDGLTAQIPSLLISLSTGILVTKGAKENEEFSETLIQQLFGLPKVLFIVGGVLIGLGIVTPLNIFLFAGFGAAFIVAGMSMKKTIGEETIQEEVAQEESEAEEIRKPENVVSLLSVDPIELEFGYGIIPLADVNQGGDLLDRVVMIRRQIALELGTVVPIIRLRDNIQLNPSQYIIKIKGIQVTEGEIMFDHYMAMNPGYIEEEIAGIPTTEPSFGLPALWITESQREMAESLGYTVDPPSIIATHLTEVIRKHIAELLTRQDVSNLIDNLKESNPAVVDELTPKLMGLGAIQKVLQNLLNEGISIRDLLSIFEILADKATTTSDTDVLTEYVRQGLKSAISGKYFVPNEKTDVVTLDPKVEQEIMGSIKQTEQGAYLTLDPETIRKIMDSTEAEIKKLEDVGKMPIVVCSPIVRMYYKKLTEEYFKDLIVVSFSEIESNVELQSVGMVTLNNDN